MKNFIITILFLSSFTGYCQDTTGLIGHWNMNGNTNDISGSGLNGTGNNLTPAVGIDGIMGHAWYFNGVNSSIIIPYSPLFNVSNYTIATTVMVQGFYTGTCHGNVLFDHGTIDVADGIYFLEFTDYPAGYGCTVAIDTNGESFLSIACSASTSLGSATWASYNTTPNVIEDKWYTVVATFNDTVFNLYVNGVLMTSVPSPTPGVPIGTNTYGASIGYDNFDVGYPYGFNGIMDDMMLYNRALTDSEVVHIYDTCGQITEQPVTSNISSSGGTATYTVNSSIVGGTYQWQCNSGSGFVNLSNAGPYSGVTTTTLTVTGSTAEANNLYRCVVSNTWGCIDTSVAASLTVGLGVGNVANNNFVSVYPNPATKILTIQSTIQPINEICITNVIGQIVRYEQPVCSSMMVQLDLSGFSGGLYFVKVNGNAVRKFVKE